MWALANGCAKRSPASKGAERWGRSHHSWQLAMAGQAVAAQPTPSSAQFGEGLPHADQASAAARGVQDDVGQTPARLLRQLEAHRLLALEGG